MSQRKPGRDEPAADAPAGRTPGVDGARYAAPDARLAEQVGKKEQRKLDARQHDRSVWFGLGMFGLVGWSIAIPTLMGIALGIWIDRTWQSRYSCTLMGLFIGVVFGCLIAWYWVQRESGDG